MSHGLFYRRPYFVSGPGNISVALLSMEDQKALGFHQKYLNLCSEDEQRSYGAFKSCRIHRIYELNAHERHHKVVITSGKLEIFFKPFFKNLKVLS